MYYITFHLIFSDKDECTLNTHSCNITSGAVCNNTGGSFFCSCQKGYTLAPNSLIECAGKSSASSCHLALYLFIICLNDIAKSSNLFTSIIYADDTTLSTAIGVILNKINNSDAEFKMNVDL